MADNRTTTGAGPAATSDHTSTRRVSIDDGEEVEVVAQLSIPTEGGWGWVVVAAGFAIMAIVDGIAFSYGSIMYGLKDDFNIPVTLASLVGASIIATYFAAGPIVSAVINRFGFRACAMTGSILSAFSLLTCYFSEVFVLFYIFYALMAGFGYCCIQMSTTLVIGFYFQKTRALAISMAFSGSSIGVMILSPANSYIVTKTGWRTVVMMQAGLLGLVYFLAMAYRPLLSLRVGTTLGEGEVLSKSVAILPSLSKVKNVDNVPRKAKPAKSEVLFNAVTNAKYPTAANMVTDPITEKSQAGTSEHKISKLTLVSRSHKGKISEVQLSQLMKIRAKVAKHQELMRLEEAEEDRKTRRKGCLAGCCSWDEHEVQQRPLYRDDVFYEGSVARLPAYKKSMANVPKEEQTGLEYQLAVSRVAAVNDLEERKGFFTKAIRRVLATMLDVTLLKRRSFLLVCFSEFFASVGYLIPFLFAVNRAITKGLDPNISKFLISTLSASVLVGRLGCGFLSHKFNPIYAYTVCKLFSGVSLVLSNLNFTLGYQFGMCIMYGFFAGAFATLRSLVLVELYGLDKLTNATGLILLFAGIGSLIGSPCILAVSKLLGFKAEFYLGGAMLILAGILLIFAPLSAKKEGGIREPPEPIVLLKEVQKK